MAPPPYRWCAFELENKRRAAILSLALYGELPFVSLDERLRDGKAQTKAAVLRVNGCVRLLERQEDARDVFRLKTDAIIVNQNNNPTGGRIITGDVDYTSNRSKLDRVPDNGWIKSGKISLCRRGDGVPTHAIAHPSRFSLAAADSPSLHHL